MHPLRKQRLIIICSCILFTSLAVALALYGLKEKVNFFYTPTEAQLNQDKIIDRFVRIGGLVKPGSIKRKDDLLYFTIMDSQNSINATYKGLIPDLFHEGKGVVAEGKVNEDGILAATKILAKHDENYMPPTIKAKLKAN